MSVKCAVKPNLDKRMLVLDTDVMVDIQRGFAPAIEWFRALPETPAITVITLLELLHGCRNRQEQQRVMRMTARMPVLYLDAPVCMRAVDYFSEFHLSHGLGILDALIAAIVATQGLTLCSFNEKHYRMIPDLSVVKPYNRE
jgi:predicted nucleic acid-binding protein